MHETDRGELVAHIISPTFVIGIRPHRADANFNTFTSEKELREDIKEMFLKQVDEMEIQHG
jgi:hypothetical protein